MGWVRWLRLSGVLILIVTLYFVMPVSGHAMRDAVVAGDAWPSSSWSGWRC